MEHAPTRQEIADWLVRARGKKALVTFAKELGVSKTALINYESGARVPPTETYLRWSQHYRDFPGARAGQSAMSADHRVSEELPVYDASPEAGIRVNVKKVTRISATLKALFAEYGLGEKHRPFRDVLFSVMERDEDITHGSLVRLTQWYCDEVVNAKSDA